MVTKRKSPASFSTAGLLGWVSKHNPIAILKIKFTTKKNKGYFFLKTFNTMLISVTTNRHKCMAIK